MSIRRHVDGHARLVDAPVASIALPGVSVSLGVSIRGRRGRLILCGGNGGRDGSDGKEQQNSQPPAYDGGALGLIPARGDVDELVSLAPILRCDQGDDYPAKGR